MNRIVCIFLLLVVAWSCKKDDDDGTIAVPKQTLAETATENDAEIKEYLQTHFYNYEEFENPAADFDFKIRFDTIAADNASKIALINQVETQLLMVESSTFQRTVEEQVQHTLYYLVVNEGSAESPTIGDDAILTYQGGLIDGSFFDASTVPVNFNLSSVVRGFGNAVEKFKGGQGPMENGDGTVSFEDYGIGAVFMPSGLGYFDDPLNLTTLANYSPLIFTFDLLTFEVDTDTDEDGIASILEDLDGDGNLNNDDTDGDGFPNHRDADDDGDGISTLDEISDDDGNILSPYPDTDGDGIPDYLDSDS